MSYRQLRVIGALLASVSLIAGCESSKDSASKDTPPPTAPKGSGTSSSSVSTGDPVADSKAAVEAAYKGTNRPAPTKGPKAQPDKTVWVITCANIIESCGWTAERAVEAGNEIGWTIEQKDGGLQTEKQAEQINSAVASGVDGIILIGIDCGKVKSPLEGAKAAGVKVVAFYGYDCNDDEEPGGEQLFTNVVNFGPQFARYSDVARGFARVKADFAIAKTEGEAKVLNIEITDYLVMQYINQGFNDRLKACTTCSVVDTIRGTQAETIDGTLKTKLISALQQHPEVNVLHVPIDPMFSLFVNGAVKEVNREDLLVVGGDGLPTAMDEIRQGNSDAEVAFPHEWTAWAAVDTMNRIFAGDTEYADTGIGWTLVDKDHNLPAEGEFNPNIDFKAALKKVWEGK